VRFVRPTASAPIQRLLAELGEAEPTYGDIGATLRGEWPPGFTHDHREVVLGTGEAVFDRAVTGLLGWRAHRLYGLAVHPPDAPIQPGATVVLTLGHMVAMAVPCRIVALIEEPDRWGFAYGTLPGHPEEGEEAFVVTMADDGEVRFEISAFSRPTNLAVRISRPVAVMMQEGYLRALRRFCERQPA
jgi:uncharacterized protein (UPF0548 family)